MNELLTQHMYSSAIDKLRCPLCSKISKVAIVPVFEARVLEMHEQQKLWCV